LPGPGGERGKWCNTENINISNITMRNVKDGPIYITLADRDRTPPPVTVGHLRHIRNFPVLKDQNSAAKK
jgi:hypothetical protein